MTAGDLGKTLQAFTQEFASALQRQTSIEPGWAGDLAPFLVDLQRLTFDGPLRKPEKLHTSHPALEHLDRAFALAEDTGQDRLLALAKELSTSVSWCLSYADEGWGAQVADRMVACQVVGPEGLWPRQKLSFGLFLLSPELFYPLHGHKAAEVYYMLGGGADFYYGSEDAEPLSRGAGQIAVTRSGNPHAIENGVEPSIVLYVWRGAILEPTWALEPDADGEPIQSFPKKRPTR